MKEDDWYAKQYILVKKLKNNEYKTFNTLTSREMKCNMESKEGMGRYVENPLEGMCTFLDPLKHNQINLVN